MFNRRLIDPRPKWLRWFLFKEPLSASSEWWYRREIMLRSRAPVRYFLQNDIPVMVSRCKHHVRDFVWWFRHRTTDQYHVVKTNLAPGYYDLDERMLHAAFSLLVEYVEVSLASRSMTESKDPKVRGLSFLHAEINEESAEQETRETSKALRDLYLWWTVERPQRLDPWSAPEIWGQTKTESSEKASVVSSLFNFRNKAVAIRGNSAKAGKIAFVTEKFYTHQDTSMLLKLVEIRTTLWS